MRYKVYALSADPDDHAILYREEYPAGMDYDKLGRANFETIDRLIDPDDEKIMSWRGYELFERDGWKRIYHDAFFVLTKKKLYVKTAMPDLKTIRCYEMKYCGYVSVGDKMRSCFPFPEVYISFSYNHLNLMYDGNDTEDFIAKLNEAIKKYGYQGNLFELFLKRLTQKRCSAARDGRVEPANADAPDEFYT